jgi:hypothetical protein
VNWQQAASLSIVAITAGLFVWAKLRRRKFSIDHDSHCGCSSGGRGDTKSSILYRARKGERPQVVVKMR